MLQLPFDIVRAIYDSLEPVDAHRALPNLLVVSKGFYAVFSPELYRRIAITTTDARIARLVKTLQKKTHLKEKVWGLTVRLSSFYAPPTTFRRIFNPVEPLEQFARLVATGQLPNLRCLAFVGERGYHSFTEWTRLSQPVRSLFFDMRCLKTIRSVRLDYIEDLDPGMVWGRDGYLALDEFRVSYLKFAREPFTQPPIITAPQPGQPHLVKTLTIHATWTLKFNPMSLGHLQRFSFDYSQGSKQSTMCDAYAIVDACKGTLREVHIRVLPPKRHTISYCFGGGPLPTPESVPVLRLDLTRHSKLHTVVIASTRHPPASPGDRLKSYAQDAVEEELSAVEMCLLHVDLPPALSMLRIRFHLLDYWDSEGQGIYDLFSEWLCLPRFETLHRMAMSLKGGRVQQLEVGITPILPLKISCAELEELQRRVNGHSAQDLGELGWISFYLDDDSGPL